MEQTQLPTQVVAPPAKSHWFILISLILGIVLFTSTIFLYFQNQQLKKQLVNQQVSSTIQTPSPTPRTVSSISISPDETANWKTYKNTALGIEFKYPSDWYYLGAGNNTLFPVVLNVVEVKEFPPDSLAGPIYFSINECTKLDTMEKYPCEKSHQDHLERIKESFTPESLKINSKFILSNRRATQLSGILKPSPAGPDTYSKITILPLDKYSFSISLYEKNLENVYDQILSTFQFVD